MSHAIEDGDIDIDAIDLGVTGEDLRRRLEPESSATKFRLQLDYLEGKGLIVRKPERIPPTESDEDDLRLKHYKMTSAGIDFVENGEQASPEAGASSVSINVANSQGVQIGSHNQQEIESSLITLVDQIDQAPGDVGQKKEAKARLARFLEHPLVVGVIGSGAAAAIGGLFDSN